MALAVAVRKLLAHIVELRVEAQVSRSNAP